METGILKQIDLKTMIERYFFVAVERQADQIKIWSTQAFKPLTVTFNMHELHIHRQRAEAAIANKKYEFNDNTGGLVSQLANWQHGVSLA
ncbi:hypothetical protein [Lactiplantibacillus songbeiensis]|jgi:hypothetical protein|uniref:Uncharacterized protein n=1 Tax=Lactiplantibacillus songbeiensis TaxID=2559920 RepID=A0ABW4BXD3_9LACO|nr:hypothetical protein [Lactiplantibacillus songbeiensis]